MNAFQGVVGTRATRICPRLLHCADLCCVSYNTFYTYCVTNLHSSWNAKSKASGENRFQIAKSISDGVNA